MGIQLEGVVRVGADAATAEDVAIDVIDIRYRNNRKTVTSAATWGDATEKDKAGASKPTLQIVLKNSSDAERLNLLLLEASQTATAELYIGWAFDDAAISAGNKLYSTTITVMGAELGGKAGEENTQTWTFPAGALASTETDPQA